VPVVAEVNDGTAACWGPGCGRRATPSTPAASGGIGICADRAVAVDGLFVAPAPLPGRWVVGGAMAALGASVDWLQSAVLRGAVSMDDLVREAAAVPPGADGLVFLPYLAGERAPVFDEAARGAFVGLTLGHGRAHLARAVLEGAAFALRSVAEPLAAAGPHPGCAPARAPGAWARIRPTCWGARRDPGDRRHGGPGRSDPGGGGTGRSRASRPAWRR
jgi:sugar (pentulose or hexulose) kinase